MSRSHGNCTEVVVDAAIFAQFSVSRVTGFTIGDAPGMLRDGGKLHCASSSETVDAPSVARVLQLQLHLPGRDSRRHQYATVIWARTCAGFSNSLTNASA